MPLKNLDVIVAFGNRIAHRGAFDNVIFVVDDLESPLSSIIYAGFNAANNAGYEHITVPTIRMGVMSGVMEKTPQDAVAHMVAGVEQFKAGYTSTFALKKATFVVYNDSQTTQLLKSGFGL